MRSIPETHTNWDFIYRRAYNFDGGQKLPVFRAADFHNQLAVQIVKQAKIEDTEAGFAIVFAAME